MSNIPQLSAPNKRFVPSIMGDGVTAVPTFLWAFMLNCAAWAIINLSRRVPDLLSDEWRPYLPRSGRARPAAARRLLMQLLDAARGSGLMHPNPDDSFSTQWAAEARNQSGRTTIVQAPVRFGYCEECGRVTATPCVAPLAMEDADA